MSKWWQTKAVAWGETIMSWAVGGLSAYLKPTIGIPIFIVLFILGIWILFKAYKAKNKSEVTQGVATLIIGAKIVDNPNLGITERMSLSLPLPTDTLRTVEIGLKISKPIVINKLALEIWGHKIDSLEFPYLKKFIDNELIEQSDIFKTGFSIPQIYAIDDSTAKIYIFANNNEYWPNPFPITFGGLK